MSSAGEPPDDRVLEDLSDQLPPPPELEERLVTELRRRGALGSGGPRTERHTRSTIWRVAASALLAFALGLWLGPRLAGRSQETRMNDEGKRYLLLLYEPRPIDRAGLDLVAEYSEWAGDLRRSGKLVAAEKLTKEELRWGALSAPGEALGGASAATDSTPAQRGEPTGFFLIRASGPEEAERIARDCPHLKHGGEVSLRPVDPT